MKLLWEALCARGTRIVRLTIYVLGLGLLVAEGASASPVRGLPPPEKPQLSASAQHDEIQQGQQTWSYLVYAPANLPAGAPLVIVFTSFGGTGATAERGTNYAYDRLADRYGFVVVYPDQFRSKALNRFAVPFGLVSDYPDQYRSSWNDCARWTGGAVRKLKIDDVGFVGSIIAHIAQTNAIDTHKVFTVGYGQGGSMAFRMALERPDEIAGIAAFFIGLPTHDYFECNPTGGPVPVMMITGGIGANPDMFSVESTAAYFAKIDGQTQKPIITRLPHNNPADPSWVQRTAWTGRGEDPVVLYTVHGGRYGPNTATGDLDGPSVVWDFFSHLRASEK